MADEDCQKTTENGKMNEVESPVNTTANDTGIDDPELNELLDDALLDFDKPLQEFQKSGKATDGGGDLNPEMNQIWSEEFIKEATAQFEKKMREYAKLGATDQQGAVGGVDTPEALQKIVEAATRAAVGQSNPGFATSLSDAMKNLKANPELENPMGINDDELSKLMNSFALGENTDDADMDEILPFMTNMMQKLLSKELLQPVLTDIVERYPDWLADNREKISAKDFDKYTVQYENMKQICEEYAKEKDSDTESIKQIRFDRISELMLKVQYAGPPPKELVGDMDNSSGLFNPADGGLGAGDQCNVM